MQENSIAGLRGMMSLSLIQLWYLIPTISDELQNNELTPESFEFTVAFKERLNDMSDGSFLDLYNRTMKKFYEL